MAVDTALIKQYFDNIMLVSQQMTSKLAVSVYQKPGCKGEMAFQDQLESVDADEKIARNEVVRNTDPSYARRKIVPRYFYKAPLVDNMDKLMLVKDPTNEIVQANAAALARAKDTVVGAALTGTAYGGSDGTSAYSLATGHIILQSSAGLNMVKIRSAKKLMDQAEVPMDGRSLAISAEEVEDLLAISEVTSSDYAQVKALVNGQPGTLCGFNLIQSERLPDSSTTGVRDCAAYHKNSAVLGIWIDLLASIDILPTVHFSAQVYAGQSYGATRLEETTVVKIECYHA